MARGQRQDAGDYSNNFQSETTIVNQYGPTLEEVHSVAHSVASAVVSQELGKLTGDASKTLESRIEDLIEGHLLPRLADRGGEGLHAFADPDVQYALRSALMAYGRSGDEDMADVLVDILIDRTKESERNSRQLALNEALRVASKLTTEHFAALSIIWIINHTYAPHVIDGESFRRYFTEELDPHLLCARKSDSIYRHLSYAGCGTISLGEVAIETCLLDNYPALFQKYLRAGDVQTLRNVSDISGAIDGMLKQVSPDSELWCFDPPNSKELRQKAIEAGIDSYYAGKIVEMNRLKKDDLRIRLCGYHEEMESLLELWNGSFMKNMSLTTVGIAIAHANCRRITGRVSGPLSIWID